MCVSQNQEIEELTKICDELIAKMGKMDWGRPELELNPHPHVLNGDAKDALVPVPDSLCTDI